MRAVDPAACCTCDSESCFLVLFLATHDGRARSPVPRRLSRERFRPRLGTITHRQAGQTGGRQATQQVLAVHAGSAFRGTAEQATRGRHGPVHVEAAHCGHAARWPRAEDARRRCTYSALPWTSARMPAQNVCVPSLSSAFRFAVGNWSSGVDDTGEFPW